MNTDADKYICVMFTNPTREWYPGSAQYKLAKEWVNNNITYPVKWYFIGSKPAGVYLKPDDALVFSLTL